MRSVGRSFIPTRKPLRYFYLAFPVVDSRLHAFACVAALICNTDIWVQRMLHGRHVLAVVVFIAYVGLVCFCFVRSGEDMILWSSSALQNVVEWEWIDRHAVLRPGY